MDISETVKKQRDYYKSGITRTYDFRLDALKRFRRMLIDNEYKINEALHADLNRSASETYMCETGMVLAEVNYSISHLASWMRDRHVLTPLAQFPARSFVSAEPYGVTLIMSPWNYPIQLCLAPLTAAMAAGNCAILKPSAYAPQSSHVIAGMIRETFPPGYVTVIEGGRDENSALLDEKFDHIFFTGSVAVGKTVMAAASRNLTPVTLELGGKSPVIVDETANIKFAARRIAFGKVLNAGQTCVEPDYLLINEGVREQFIEEYKAALDEFFPEGDMSEMPTIINQKHYDRVTRLLKSGRIVTGGGCDPERRFVEPTLMTDVDPDSPIMQEEIFGPILPVLTYGDIEECIEFIQARPKPLSLYLFTRRKETERRILSSCSFGGGCINDTIIHLATSRMGFGGVGDSGRGSYHGRHGFETFSHYRSIVKKSNLIDIPLRYHPYNKMSDRIIRKLMK